MGKQKQVEGGSFWKKIENSRKIGLTEGEFSKIEELEGAIAKYENDIEDFQNEIKAIQKEARNRKELKN
jgi:hypothetical protein